MNAVSRTEMLTPIPMMVAAYYPYSLILGPALIIVLAIALALLVKYPSSRGKIGAFLVLLGIAEVYTALHMAFYLGFFIGLGTVFVGIVVGLSALLSRKKTHFNLTKPSAFRKGAFVVLAMVIVASSLLISLRATNIVHEQWLEKYWGGNTPNLTLRGVVTDVRLNHEINTGYSYHIFPAYVTLNVTEVVWAGEYWQNQTTAAGYWLNQGSAVIGYEKTDAPELLVGQQVEVKGFFCLWMEDSLYSGMVVISPDMNEGYIRLL
jgi:hypothetical protein